MIFIFTFLKSFVEAGLRCCVHFCATERLRRVCVSSFLWLRRSPLLPVAFLDCSGRGLPSSFHARAFHCSGFSRCAAQAPGRAGSGVVRHGLSLPCGTWDLPGPGIKLVPLALHGRFLTTGPPGSHVLFQILSHYGLSWHIDCSSL